MARKSDPPPRAAVEVSYSKLIQLTVPDGAFGYGGRFDATHTLTLAQARALLADLNCAVASLAESE